MSVEPGIHAQTIGKRYLIRGTIGQGGMGVVYHATDRLLMRDVALKRVISTPADVVEASTGGVTDFRMALAREFKLSASLRHPNIVEVLDYGFDESSQPYFTMELLESPRTVLDYALSQPIEQRLRLIVQILNALAYVHRRGLVHRDLKPANVLTVGSIVKVLDFGLSTMHVHTGDEGLEADMAAGTLAYIAPEVLLSNDVGITADLYAVGLMGYEFLAGKHPFDVNDPGKLINQILYEVPDAVLPDVPIEVAHVFNRLLQKEPEARYKSAIEVIDALSASASVALKMETAATRDSFLHAARLVGRDTELKQLTDALDDTFKGHGSTWLVAGESGVGKSRLLDELRTQAMVSGAVVVRGQAANFGGQLYESWQPLLRWLCLWRDTWDDADVALLKTLVPDVGSLLGRDVSAIPIQQATPEAQQVRLIELLTETLKQLDRPVVLLFEDLHWVGSESLNMLKKFVEHVADLPLLLIGSYRDDESPNLDTHFAGVPVIELRRLDSDSIAQLSEAMLGESGSRPQVVNLLQRETEGNVFFLIEVVRALAEEAGQLDEIGRMTLPERVFAGGINTVVQNRLSRLDEAGYDLLRLAAIMGRQVDTYLLKHLAPADMRFDLWLTTCSDAVILEVEEDNWRFTHDKLRESVLNDLSPEETTVLHQRVAEALEAYYGATFEYINALAYYWGQAGNAAKEGHYLTLSAEQSLKNGAYHEAVAAFRRVLDLLPHMSLKDDEIASRRIFLKQQQAQAHLGFGDYETAQHLYRETLLMSERLGIPEQIARSLGFLGDVAYVLAHFEDARSLYQKSLDIYRAEEDRVGIARTLNNLGNVAYELDEDELARHYYQDSLHISREIGEEWGMAGALRQQSTEDVRDEGEYEATRELLEETLSRYTESGDRGGIADALHQLGLAAQDSGDYTTARQHYDQAVTIRRNIGDDQGLAQTLERLGIIAIEEGKLNVAWTHLRESLQAAVRVEMRSLSLFTLMSIARLLIAQQQHIPALELLAHILYSPHSQESLQDSAEQLLFELEDELAPAVIEQAWETGKSRSYDEIMKAYLTG